MKRVLAFVLGLLALGMASLTVSGTAFAAGADLPDDCPNKATAPANNLGPNCEEADTTFTLTPRKGEFYQGGNVAADWKVNVQVNAPYPGKVWNDDQGKLVEPDVLPLKRVEMDLPKDMTFSPDPKMPVCPDSKFGPATPKGVINQPPAEVIKLCPKSVIGNGTADLFISHKNAPTGPNIKDPTLIVFNAGLENGRPKIKIHGYSKATTAGIYMEGVLTANNGLAIAVPPLSNDSAVSRFDLNIPGTTPIKYNNRTLLESAGQDPNYLQARCSTGSWLLTSKFLLGTRDDAGNATSPTSELDAPNTTNNCTGKAGKPPVAGKPKIGKVKVKGAARAKRGKTVVFRVSVRNAGKAVAKGVKITVKGKGAKGSAKAGNIAAGKTKTVKVKVKLKKKGKVKLTFTAKGAGAGSAKAVKRVTVR